METASLYVDRSQWTVLSAKTFQTENHRPIDPILRAMTHEHQTPQGCGLRPSRMPLTQAAHRIGPCSCPSSIGLIHVKTHGRGDGNYRAGP